MEERGYTQELHRVEADTTALRLAQNISGKGARRFSWKRGILGGIVGGTLSFLVVSAFTNPVSELAIFAGVSGIVLGTIIGGKSPKG